MNEQDIIAIDNFTRAVTALKIDRDGVEGSETSAIEAALLSLPPVWQAITNNPEWHQVEALRGAANAAGALLTTLNVISDNNPAIVAEFAFAWGDWLQSRLNAANGYINDQQSPGAE